MYEFADGRDGNKAKLLAAGALEVLENLEGHENGEVKEACGKALSVLKS